MGLQEGNVVFITLITSEAAICNVWLYRNLFTQECGNCIALGPLMRQACRPEKNPGTLRTEMGTTPTEDCWRNSND